MESTVHSTPTAHTIQIRHDAGLIIVGNQVVNGLDGTVTVGDYPGEKPHRRFRLCFQIGRDAICEVGMSAVQMLAACRFVITQIKSDMGDYIKFEEVPTPTA